jgi:uncharacterized membrane protein
MVEKLSPEDYYKAIGVDRNHMILSALFFPYGFYKGFSLGKEAKNARQRRIARLYKSLAFFGMMLYAFIMLIVIFRL